ncbi:uncharacterized protein BYT42DRAFT_584532 [Radiomyces spectabilis]|uniref:uncharacterized protein n=1 Tax=Radiomyces spectabilis TaxID=64574 RepID=UPI002220EF72|nr:uncharacterized protein BYT42DRAFT_584532 [Radiomyces spectabilis]KAI8369453.1 hypothetical protein BYT42DRAFT_584532 [Radiomyces spectabilis]
MGIHGLYAFIRAHDDLKRSRSWNRECSETTFIVDGNAFVYHMAFQNRTDWAHGGQYATFAEQVRRFVSSLQDANIALTFLFDGALPPDKQATRKQRYRSYIERACLVADNLQQINDINKSDQADANILYHGDMYLIPPLNLEICLRTIRDMGVTTMVCNGEADSLVARMAQENNGYILSKDTDMHVYPHVGKGYIPLDSLTVTETGVTADVYHPDQLSFILKIEKHILPLFGTLLGNDYLNVETVKPPITLWCINAGHLVKGQSIKHWPKCVIEFLKHVKGQPIDTMVDSIVDQLRPLILKSNVEGRHKKAESLKQCITSSIQRYDPESPLISTEAPVPRSGCFSPWQLSRHILDIKFTQMLWSGIFVEDLRRESSWIISRHLRQCIYALLLRNSGPVIEYFRQKRHLTSEPVLPIQLDTIQPINPIDSDFTSEHLLGDRLSCQSLYASMHHTDHTQFSSIDHGSIIYPIVACIRYLALHLAPTADKLTNAEVMGLLVSTLKSIAPLLGFTTHDVPVRHFGKPSLKRKAMHLTAQYQSVLYCSYLLAQTLNLSHFEMPGLLANLYNGLSIHHHLQLARQGASLKKFLAGVSPRFVKFVLSVYTEATRGFTEDGTLNISVHYTEAASAPPKATATPAEPRGPINKKRAKERSMDGAQKRDGQPKLAKTQTGNGNMFDVLSFGCSFDG